MTRSLAHLGAAVGIVAAFGLSLVASVHSAESTRYGERCFSAQDWRGGGNVADGLRPCARIARIWEDGSVRIRVYDASGRFRYSAGIGARDR